jgi:hypothetical protein
MTAVAAAAVVVVAGGDGGCGGGVLPSVWVLQYQSCYPYT